MLKLNHSPTFIRTVEIPITDGKVAKIECTFRWMNVRDLGLFIGRARMAAYADRWPVRISQAIIRTIRWVPGLRKWADQRLVPYKTEFDYMNQIIESWSGVDLEWGPEACDQLVKTYPHAVTIILAAWAKGLEENRMGN